jgi:hypothetical protein
MFAFRGVNSSAPVNASAKNNDSGTTFSATGLTTNVDNCMIVVAVGFNDYGSEPPDTSNFSSWANANLESISEGFDSLQSNSSYNSGIACAFGVKATAGATGATTATADDSTNYSAAITFALTPA